MQAFIESDTADNLTFICAQECRLEAGDRIVRAIQWCSGRGWLAHITPASINPSGEPVSGVAVLVRDGLDLGVQPIPFPPGTDHSRLAGVIIEAPGVPEFGLVSAYFHASSGLCEVNLQLLATIGQTQDLISKPLIVAGDYNVQPERLQKGTDFLTRGSMQIAAPMSATYRTKKSKSTLDFFIHSQVLSPWVEAPLTLTSYPLSPHRPVIMAIRVLDNFKIPTLLRPQKLPTRVPVGPQLPSVSWHQTAAVIDYAIQLLGDAPQPLSDL